MITGPTAVAAFIVTRLDFFFKFFYNGCLAVSEAHREAAG